MTKLRYYLPSLLLQGSALLGTGLFILYIIINFLLGCESWDQEYWTANNSCMYPLEFLSIFVPPFGR